MITDLQSQQQNVINTALLVAIMKKLEAMGKTSDKISRKMADKMPILMTAEAIKLYQKHLMEGLSRRGRPFKKAQNYGYLLALFGGVFGKRNLASLTAEEIDVFLRHYWSTPSTLRQRRNELSSFFAWCIKLLQKRRKPSFINPCSLLDPIPLEVERPEFIESPVITQVIESAANERQWLIHAILATAGLRISELLGLKKREVKGQVLTLHGYDGKGLKSGKVEELAVIPLYVSKRLAQYAKDYDMDGRLFKIQHTAVYKGLRARGQYPHGLRKWCITFWDRQREPAMESFVRRHSGKGLRERYVAPLTTKEAIEKIRLIEKALWKSR